MEGNPKNEIKIVHGVLSQPIGNSIDINWNKINIMRSPMIVVKRKRPRIR